MHRHQLAVHLFIALAAACWADAVPRAGQTGNTTDCCFALGSLWAGTDLEYCRQTQAVPKVGAQAACRAKEMSISLAWKARGASWRRLSYSARDPRPPSTCGEGIRNSGPEGEQAQL